MGYSQRVDGSSSVLSSRSEAERALQESSQIEDPASLFSHCTTERTPRKKTNFTFSRNFKMADHSDHLTIPIHKPGEMFATHKLAVSGSKDGASVQIANRMHIISARVIEGRNMTHVPVLVKLNGLPLNDAIDAHTGDTGAFTLLPGDNVTSQPIVELSKQQLAALYSSSGVDVSQLHKQYVDITERGEVPTVLISQSSALFNILASDNGEGITVMDALGIREECEIFENESNGILIKMPKVIAEDLIERVEQSVSDSSLTPVDFSALTVTVSPLGGGGWASALDGEEYTNMTAAEVQAAKNKMCNVSFKLELCLVDAAELVESPEEIDEDEEAYSGY